ncbi:hypothetical protein I3843_06G061900 [Carya illinoinensis]|nr:hypothetical protein I3843_06G061900 [Carya illinoinensis]
MKFLMGLNDSFKNIKAQIILLKPVPSLSEIYALIQQEEKRDISKPFNSQRQDKLFYTFYKVSGHSLEKCFKANPNLEKPTCTHCHLVGHTAKRCYKLHDYPPNHKLANRPKGHDPSINQISLSNQE